MNRVLVAVIIVGSPLVGAGCSKSPPLPNTQPTAFFEWCHAKQFGVASPEGTSRRSAAKNVASGQIGLAERMAWTPCNTESEARKFLADTIAELRRVATDHGIAVVAGDDLANAQDYRVVFTYQSGPNHGTLEAKYALADTKTDGKAVKAYFVYYKLTEMIGVAK